MTYIPGADYFVYWVPFPVDNGTDGGAVTLNEDGTYSILMDERLLFNRKKAKKTFRHEVEHIENEDFFNGKPIADIENI